MDRPNWLPRVITVPRPSARGRGFLPLWIMGSACFVAIWGGWVDLGSMTGFGPVELFPGIWPAFRPNTAITLPLSMEVYGSYALRWWIDKSISKAARMYAMVTAISALVLGMLAQAGAHLLEAKIKVDPGWQVPWGITMVVAWVPVIVFGFGAGLHAMVNRGGGKQAADAEPGLPEVAHEPEPLQEPEQPLVQENVHPPVPGVSAPERPRLVPRPADANDDRLPLPEDEDELRALVLSTPGNALARTHQITRYRHGQLKQQYENETGEQVA